MAAVGGPTGAGGSKRGLAGASHTYDRLQYGDLVAFYVEDKGFLAAPAINEPIPLAPSFHQPSHAAGTSFHETAGRGNAIDDPPLSHLRAARPLHPGTKVPADFHNRCIWEVLSEGGVKSAEEPVTYGSTVQLRHTKTGFLITVDTMGAGIQSTAAAGALGPPPLTPVGPPTLHAHGGANEPPSSGPRIFTRLRRGAGPGAAVTGLLSRGGAGGGGGGSGDTSASQFYLRPRYSVRAEGDYVRDQDRVVFESCRFKGRQLCLEEPKDPQSTHDGSPAEMAAEEPEGVVSMGDDAYLRSGWQLHLVSRARHGLPPGLTGLRSGHSLAAASGLSATATAAAAAGGGKAVGGVGDGLLGALEEGSVICGGDFVRFAHQEIIGHLIARVDDGAERCSRISPLGMVYRKFQLEKERATGIFLRRGSTQPSVLSVFQVIPQQITSGQPVEWDAPVRLRHLLTGQYVALRPAHPEDNASIHAAAKLTHVCAPRATTQTSGDGGGRTPALAAARPTTAATEESDAGSGVDQQQDLLPPMSIIMSPPAESASAAAVPPDEGAVSSPLDSSAGSDESGTATTVVPTPATADAPLMATGASSQHLRGVRLVIATVSDPEDPAALFRFHPVRDAEGAFVTSKSKCLLVHHDTGAHLSLGPSTIAHHGKMSGGLSRAPPAAGKGGAGEGLWSFASVSMAARAAAGFARHDEKRKAGGEADGGAPQARYWEYENDSLVFASCEDNSDAEVYRIYHVKPATTRSLLYAMRFQTVISEAVDVVRSMRLDVLPPPPPAGVSSPHAATFGTTAATNATTLEPLVEDGGISSLRSAGGGSHAKPSTPAGPPLLSPTRLTSNHSSLSLRLTRGGATMSSTLRPEERYVGTCQHLLAALHELVLWQAGEIATDGEIQRREGVPLFSLAGDDGSVRPHRAGGGGGSSSHRNNKKGGMPTGSSSAAAGVLLSFSSSSSSSFSSQNLMEKDEDSFEFDMTTRRRELLRNCGVVEGLLMFISVAFQLYRGRTYARTRAEIEAAALRGDMAASAVMAATDRASSGVHNQTGALPDAHLLSPDAIPLIDACARFAYKLLREIMTPSCALSVLYLAGVNSMVRHISLGWDPPIEEILATATTASAPATTSTTKQRSGGSNNSSGGDESAAASSSGSATDALGGRWSQYRLSCTDLYALVLELYASYMKKEITGTKILTLLANVCAPGNVVDAEVQTFLAGLTLHTRHKDDASVEDPAQVPQVTSLLFSLRPGGAQGGWQVHLSLLQEKPLYTPDARDMQLFTEAERGMIKEAFARYDEDGNGAIDREELRLLLQDLGLQSLIVEEVQSRWTGSIGFEEFCQWWHRHRHILESWSSPLEFSNPSPGQSPRARPVEPSTLASTTPAAEEQGGSATAAAGTDLPPPLSISTVGAVPTSSGSSSSSNIRRPSTAPTKVDSPISTMKRCADQSTRALPPRSLTVDDDAAGDLFSTRDAIFRRWIDIELVFTHERFAAEAQWIRASVRLLIALCRERNLVSQKLVGAIMPVDAILFLLHSKALGEADKALFCDLLRALYVEHDLVFPVSPLLPRQAVCLSLDPEQVSYGEMGRIFNPLSQATLSLMAAGSKPMDQRTGLRAFLGEHLGRLERYAGTGTAAAGGTTPPPPPPPQQQQREAFATSLLRLTHALLLQGFFEPEMPRRRPRGERAVTDAGGGVSARSIGGHTVGLLTSFFGAGIAGQDDSEEGEQQGGGASEWGPPMVLEQTVAAAAAATGISMHASSPKREGLLQRLVGRPPKTTERASAAHVQRRHVLTYSFLEATLIVTLDAAGRATVARAKVANGGESACLQDLQVSGSGAYSAVFDELGPIALKAEVVGLLRTLADIRSVKNAKALLSSLRPPDTHGPMATASHPHNGRGSLALGGRESVSGGGGGSKAMSQLRFGRAQEAVLDRGFDDRTSDGEMLINAVVGTTAHRDKCLLVKAYDLLYRHSTQRVAFAALLDELGVSRRPSLAITMRTQRLALQLFDKYQLGFHQTHPASCDVLSYALHLLTRLCYRNWDEGPLPLISPTATADGLPGGGISAARGPSVRQFRAPELDAIFAASNDDYAAGGARGGPFEHDKVPFVNAASVGLEDACSQPIRAQQEELQRATRRVASFLARVLQAEGKTGAGTQQPQRLSDHAATLLKKASTLSGSGASSDTCDTFHTAALHLTPTAGTAFALLDSEQRRVVHESFAFLYHACRDHPDLIQTTALPILGLLRAFAAEIPHAMRLLAALARAAPRATVLGIDSVEGLLTMSFSSSTAVDCGLSAEVQAEALGLVRALLEAECPAQYGEGACEGEGNEQHHRPYTLSSAPHLCSHDMLGVVDGERLALKAAVLDAVARRLLLVEEDQQEGGGDSATAVHFSLAAMGLMKMPTDRASSTKANKARHHPPSSSSPMLWRPPDTGSAGSGKDGGGLFASRGWAFKAEALALVCFCLDAATQLEEAHAETVAIGEQEEVEGPSPVLEYPALTVSRAREQGAGEGTEPSSRVKSLNAVQAVRERIAVLFPPRDCLTAAMDSRIPLPVRTLLLRLVKLQAFATTASGAVSTGGALSVDISNSRPGLRLPPGASPPPPPLEEARLRLAAAAAASAKAFELMQTFAGGCQHEVDALRRSLRLGRVTMKEMEGMAAFPYLAKALPAFLLAFLRRQGCSTYVQDALQTALASAKRRLEKEQARSRLWKATTEGVLPAKVGKALLSDGGGEEVMAWIVDAFVHTAGSTGARAAGAGAAATEASSDVSPDVSAAGSGAAGGGFLATLGRVASGRQLSGRSLHHLELHGPPPPPTTSTAAAASIQEPETPSLQLKVLGQMLGLIERLAGLVLHVPAIQAQWAAAPDPVAQNLLVLLAFGVMAEKVYHLRGSPQQLAALAMGRAPSGGGVSLQGATLRALYRKSTLDGSVASRGESTPPGQTVSSFLGATLGSLPGIGRAGGGNGSSNTTNNVFGAAAAANGTGIADSRFVLYLTQALDARRAAARAGAEEEELVGRQLPAALEEAQSYVLNVYDPPETDDGSGNGCIPGACIPTSRQTGPTSSAASGPPSAVAATTTTAPPCSPARLSRRHDHHHSPPVAPTASSPRMISYPPIAAPKECALARVLWWQFQGFMESYYEDAAPSSLFGYDDDEGEAPLADEETWLRRQRQQQQYEQQLNQLLQSLRTVQQAGSSVGGAASGYSSLLEDEDFRVWSKSGGLFLEHLLLLIRHELWEDSDCCLFFLDIVAQFLQDGLGCIRREGAAHFDAQRLIRLVQAEVRSTQRKQHALQALDAHTVLMALIAQAAQPSLATAASASSTKAAHLLKIMPPVLRFGTRLMATGNRGVQEAIMDFQDRAAAELLVQRKFCVGLRSLMRLCRSQVEALMYSSSSALSVGAGSGEAQAFDRLVAESQPTLALITALFDFVGALCAGHNMRARTFLREQRLSGDTVNLVAESASLLNTTCSYALTLMTYVQNRSFVTKVAPPVHPSQARKTGRRFIAWHHSPRKFAHLTDLLRVLGHGFTCLTGLVQGPCHENQVICERLCAFAGEVLEYTGTLHLELPSQWTHGRVWCGGDPLRFYELYVWEMSRVAGAGNGSSEASAAAAVGPPLVGEGNGACHHHHQQQQEAEEREAALIVESLRQWRRVGERKLFSLHLHVTKAISKLASRNQATAATAPSLSAAAAVPLTSNDILGVDLGEFAAVCLHTETSCLQFLTAMLEGQASGVVNHVRRSIDSWILFQNMDSLVRSSSTTDSSSARGDGGSGEKQRKAERQEAAVLYLTILSTLASLSGVQGEGDYGAKMSKALEEWQEAFSKQGASRSIGGGGANKHISMLVSSVEIVGADGQVQVVHFPVPEWIKTYWTYPLVQKAKDELTYQVNRASPEEKILDFYDRMAVLTKVMRRQELLHKVFSVFHGFVGGKSLGDSRFLPSPRGILLCLTLLLNMWLCTRLYYKDNAGESSPAWTALLAWRFTDRLIWSLKVAHLALCTSLLFTAALNSGAGDAVRGHRLRLLGLQRTVSFDWLVSLVIVLNDVRWLLCMSVLSSVGLWLTEVAYAFCVVDVVPQIRLMKSLLEAITRNGHKIWLTVLLCLVVLYVFSTISYLAFPNQYGFEDHFDCNSLITCFKLHLDYGILTPMHWKGDGAINPDVHTTLADTPQGQRSFDFAMTILSSLFNLSYVILVNLVLTAIIAGLIIDTFSQARSESEAKEEDMQERCFICSIDRDMIESAGVSFRDHIKHQHNMWSYFWFRTFLNGKDPLTFTGPEHYAFQMFKDRRHLTRFFPLKKSLIIERKNIELKSKSQMDVLAGRVGSVETQLAKLSLAVERLAESQAGMGVKLAQEQHLLAGGVGEVVETMKALQQQWQQQQQRQQREEEEAQQHASTMATRGRDTFLSKVTMAQKRTKQQQAAGSDNAGSPPRSGSPHWRAARTGLAKAVGGARMQEEKDGGGGHDSK